MSEQWKTDGKCPECRRVTYCKTQCTKSKRAIRKFYEEAMRKYREQMTEAENPQTDEEKQ